MLAQILAALPQHKPSINAMLSPGAPLLQPVEAGRVRLSHVLLVHAPARACCAAVALGLRRTLQHRRRGCGLGRVCKAPPAAHGTVLWRLQSQSRHCWRLQQRPTLTYRSQQQWDSIETRLHDVYRRVSTLWWRETRTARRRLQQRHDACSCALTRRLIGDLTLPLVLCLLLLLELGCVVFPLAKQAPEIRSVACLHAPCMHSCTLLRKQELCVGKPATTVVARQPRARHACSMPTKHRAMGNTSAAQGSQQRLCHGVHWIGTLKEKKVCGKTSDFLQTRLYTDV